jgi:hypothetical protein
MSFSTHSELTLKEDGSAEHAEDQNVPSSVLHIRISRVLYPVAVDTLHQVRAAPRLGQQPHSSVLCCFLAWSTTWSHCRSLHSGVPAWKQ